MNIKKTPILSFEIIGLHGDRNITVNFESPVKILVGENGSGKTTVLNILFNVLTGNWHKVDQYNFASIKIKFSKKEEICINKSDLLIEGNSSEIDFLLRDMARILSPRAYMELTDLINGNAPLSIIEAFIRQESALSSASGNVREVLRRELQMVRRQMKGKQLPLFNEQLHDKLSKIKKCFPYNILYFPTYRRVEEDLRSLSLGIDVDPGYTKNEQLIQFGMSDVNERWLKITSEIKNTSVEWYSIINGKMLSQLIGGIQKEAVDMDKLKNPEVFRIVLDRIGENISIENKEHILQLISTQEIQQEKYLHLAYFLLNLVQVYDRQRNNDNAIKNFARVVNGYLDNKEVRYNESKVDIEIVNKRSNIAMPLNKLSSGEKQVISLFSVLYLEKSTEPYAVLFDEPELSLSLEWQKKLLSDITSSENCAFLLAATHSPFIFENELDPYAEVLKVNFIKE